MNTAALINSPTLRTEIRKILRHEVGHLVMAKIMGFKTGSISFVMHDLRGAHEASAEVFLQNSLLSVSEVANYLERRIMVLFAGALAEAVDIDDVGGISARKSISEGDGRTDGDKVQDLVHLLRNIRCPHTASTEQMSDELNSIWNGLWEKSAAIVKQEYVLLKELAANLAPRIQMIGERLYLDSQDVDVLPGLQSLTSKTKIQF